MTKQVVGSDGGRRALVVGAGSLLFAVAMGCQTPIARGQMGETHAERVKAAASLAEDGIIVRWEQTWRLEKNGSVSRRDHRQFKFLSSRPIRALGDPRIDFNTAQDKVKIHVAQTTLADGTVLPVPDYSFNAAGPSDVAGWPMYTDWQQTVVSYSGIENGCVIELDYEVSTKPDVVRWIEADLRLHDDYPTAERVISVTVPSGVTLHHQVEGWRRGGAAPTTESGPDGATTYHWKFKDVPGARGEPQSPPWRQRCGRLRFTTCPSAKQWVSAMVRPAVRAAQPDEAIKRFVEIAVEDETDPIEQIRLISKKIHDSFNFIHSWKARRELNCRSAGEVLQTNYGNDLESAALCLAAIKTLDLPASPAVAVDATVWNEKVPTDSAMAGLVVAVNLDDRTVYVHPQHGVIRNPGNWGRHRVLGVTDTGTLSDTYIYARGQKRPSELHVTGKISIDADAKAAGELRLRLTGAYYDPARLKTAGAQKNLVKNFVGRVLSEFEVRSHSIVTLSDDRLEAAANVASSGALPGNAGQHLLRLGDGPAFLGNFSLPLDRSYRNTDVHLPGAFRESVDLTIEFPEGWKASIVPAELSTVQGTWGSVSQQVDVAGRTVRIQRAIRVDHDRISPDDFASLRDAVNRLRVAQSLLLALEKS